MVSMSEKRFEEITEAINKHNIINSLCGGMSSYDCVITELYDYTLQLKSQLQQKDDVVDEAIDKLKHIIDYLEKQDMFHNYESELLDILTKYKGENKQKEDH